MKWLNCAFLLGIVWCAPASARADDVGELVKQLKNSDSDVRRAAAKSLADMGKDAAPALPALLAALKSDKDLFVRRFAADAIGAIGEDPKRCVPILAAALKDALKESKRELCDSTIGAMGKMGAPAVPPLIDVLKTTPAEKGNGKPKKDAEESDESFLRRKVVLALGTIGKDARPAVPALIDGLKDPAIRSDVANTLGEIGPGAKDAIPALTDAAKAKGKDKAFKKAAAEALKKIQADS